MKNVPNEKNQLLLEKLDSTESGRFADSSWRKTETSEKLINKWFIAS